MVKHSLSEGTEYSVLESPRLFRLLGGFPIIDIKPDESDPAFPMPYPEDRFPVSSNIGCTSHARHSSLSLWWMLSLAHLPLAPYKINTRSICCITAISRIQIGNDGMISPGKLCRGDFSVINRPSAHLHSRHSKQPTVRVQYCRWAVFQFHSIISSKRIRPTVIFVKVSVISSLSSR